MYSYYNILSDKGCEKNNPKNVLFQKMVIIDNKN